MDRESILREAICWAGRRLHAYGYAAANGGNVSVRFAEGLFLTTPTGISKGDLEPSLLVMVNEAGETVEGTGVPSSEVHLHLAVYRARPRVNAVVHAHPPYATAFAAAGQVPKEPLLAEALLAVGPVGLVPYHAPGSLALAGAVADGVAGHNALLLSNHGALTCGESLKEAQFRMESLEFYAQVSILSRNLGPPRLLTQAEVRELRS